MKRLLLATALTALAGTAMAQDVVRLGTEGAYPPFPGSVPRPKPEPENLLDTCKKLYPTVRLIEQKKSRLSASERRQVLAGFKWRWDRLDNSQKEELQKFVQEYQS